MNIVMYPNSILARECKMIVDVNEDILKLANGMIETLKLTNSGIGLSAPQVGKLLRMIVVDCERSSPVVMINPEIVSRSEVAGVAEEGCLSIPGLRVDVERPLEVDVKWTDTGGNSRNESFNGIWSRCVQHEIDHLNGKLIVDGLSSTKRDMIKRKMKKIQRKQ